jgi:hypothetical protein
MMAIDCIIGDLGIEAEEESRKNLNIIYRQLFLRPQFLPRTKHSLSRYRDHSQKLNGSSFKVSDFFI